MTTALPFYGSTIAPKSNNSFAFPREDHCPCVTIALPFNDSSIALLLSLPLPTVSLKFTSYGLDSSLYAGVGSTTKGDAV